MIISMNMSISMIVSMIVIVPCLGVSEAVGCV